MIHDIMRKPNSIIVLLYIFHIIHPLKQKRSFQLLLRVEDTVNQLNKRTPLNKPIVFIVFLVLLSFCPGLLSSIVRQLCLLHEVSAKHSAILFLRRTLQGA